MGPVPQPRTTTVEQSTDLEAPTANSATRNYVPNQDETQAISVNLTWVRDTTNLINKAARELQDNHRQDQLTREAYLKARNDVPSLLEELGVDRGMAWADIAQLVGVSVSAIRKWRKEGGATAENRLKLGRLAAFLDFLEAYPIMDPAQWLEIPLALPEGIELRPFDLYKAGHEVQLLEFASGKLTIEEALDEIDRNWRVALRDDFEVFTAPDGDRGIRFRGDA